MSRASLVEIARLDGSGVTGGNVFYPPSPLSSNSPFPLLSLRAVPCRSLSHGADPLDVPAGLGLQVRTSALTYLLVVVRKQMSDINVLPRYPSPAPAVASVFHYGPQPLRQRDTGSPSSPPLRWLLAALLDVQKRTPSSAASEPPRWAFECNPVCAGRKALVKCEC